MGTFKNLTAYKKSFDLAVEIYNVSKKFPTDEMYGLTSQIRRSSRSVTTNVAEGYRKRMYEAHFVSKSSDADMENTETQVWLDFALEFGYLNRKNHSELTEKSVEIGKLINHMIVNPKKYIGSINTK